VIRTAWLPVLILCAFSITARAETELGGDETQWLEKPSNVLAFADYLYDTGDYQRAIGEYKRFRYLFPDEPRVLQAQFKIGASYQKMGHLENAIESFEEILRGKASPDIVESVRYEIGKCFFLGTDYGKSAELFDELDSDRALLMAGWSLLKRREYRTASDQFARARDSNPDGYLAELALLLSRESLKGETIAKKSPALALALSVPLPGAGRCYCGRVGDGIFSFLLVSASYLGAYHFNDTGDDVSAAAFLAVGLFFHAGDLYGAANSARRYNVVNEETFIREIEGRHNLRGILLD
jgi:tetratricopeptide (TPR) repeat protein